MASECSESYYDTDLSQGECPWVPNALNADVKTSWVEGVQWESKHFDEEAPRRVDTLTDATRREQSRALLRLFKETYSQSRRHLFFQTALLLERLVLTVGVPPVFMMEAATACYLCRAEQSGAYPCVLDLSDRLRGALDLDPVFGLIVREVARRFADEPRMMTAVDWFGNFLLSVPESRRPALTQNKVDTMFLALIFEPSQLADQRPSVSAGAVLTHLMGAEEAEPYLCGYDLFDVSAALSEVTTILTSDHITTLSPLQESDD